MIRKCFFVIFITTSAVLFSPQILHAEENVTQNNTSSLKNYHEKAITNIKKSNKAVVNKQKERKEKIEERKVTITQRFGDRKQAILKRILTHARRALKRRSRILDRLNNIFKRVQSRIGKIANLGADTSSLTSLIKTANDKKTDVNTAIAKAEAALSSIEGSSEPRQAVKTFVNELHNVNQSLRDYHKAIKEVFTEMKNIRKTITQTTPVVTDTSETK